MYVACEGKEKQVIFSKQQSCSIKYISTEKVRQRKQAYNVIAIVTTGMSTYVSTVQYALDGIAMISCALSNTSF